MIRFLPNKILPYQLYIYQLEEYDTNRFTKAITSKGLIPPKTLRKKVVWTSKAKALTLIAVILMTVFAFMLSYLLNYFFLHTITLFALVFLLLLYSFFIFSFVFLAQAQTILRPIENKKKRELIKEATQKIVSLKSINKEFKIIGITGSYGKTTMKEVITQVLDSKYKVVSTFENQNTPIGIARKILNDVDKKTEILVVEMGEYVKGDVDAICKITPPDISIITGINEAHLERYGTMQNAIDTKFEIVENTKAEGLVLLNADDALTVENYKRFAKDKKIVWFSSKNSELSEYKVKKVTLDQNKLELNFVIDSPKKEGIHDGIIDFHTKFLAEYIIGNIIAAMIVASELGLRDTEVRLGVSQLKPVEHRLEASMLTDNIVLIDDTYNGNSNGIQEGINLLKKFDGRRKVYITPGLVETGDLSESIHLEIGARLAKVADLVVLIKNSVTPFIEKGLVDAGFNVENIIWFDDAKTTYSSLRNFVKEGDVVMMQNDWSDNYS